MSVKQRILSSLQKLAKAFLIPASIIAASSLLIGLSAFFTNAQILEYLPFLNNVPVQYVAGLFNKAGSIVMSNLPLIYAISLAATMTDGDREYAGFAGALGFIAFITGMGVLITTFPNIKAMFPEPTIIEIYGIETINTGMVGGILVGTMTAALHRKVRHIKFPSAFSFFQGSRFTPFAAVVFFMFFGQLFPFAWVWLSKGVSALALVVQETGIFGPFIYSTVEKLLIPTGLHTVWNTVIRDTAVSGTFIFESGIIEGCRPAYFQSLVEGLPPGTSMVELVKFLRGGQIPMMMFALPAISLAIYKCADEDKRAKIKPLLIAGATTAFVANISEPLEFLFMFAAPLLYVIYAVINGLGYLFVYLLGSQVGGITSSFLGFILYGLMVPGSKWIIIVIVGIIQAAICYLLFRWWIVKFNVKTPGRGDDDSALAFAAEVGNIEMESTKSEGSNQKSSASNITLLIIEGLGGQDNIEEVESCMSRLRVVLKDESLVNEGKLNATGCMGIVRPGANRIQVIYGPKVINIKNDVRKELGIDN